MKNLFTLALLSLFAFKSLAQNTPIPEFKNKVMFVDANNTLAELEKTDMTTALKTSMTGKSEVNIMANENKAGVSRSGNPADNYIVKIESGIDPETVVELFKFEVAKKNRKILVAQMSMGKDNAVQLPKATIAFKKVADGVYTISSKEQLESGEYCFMVNRPNITILGASSPQSMIGYCFSVPGK